MGRHEDKCMVNEANYLGHDCLSRLPWLISKKKLAKTIVDVCMAYYRLGEMHDAFISNTRDAENTHRVHGIEIRQLLAHAINKHCGQTFVFEDGAFKVGTKPTVDMLKMLLERVETIAEGHRHGHVIGAKLKEVREEFTRERQMLRDRIGELESLIAEKDKTLLAVSERCLGQSEALAHAAKKQPSSSDVSPYCTECGSIIDGGSPLCVKCATAAADRSHEVVSDPGDDL